MKKLMGYLSEQKRGNLAERYRFVAYSDHGVRFVQPPAVFVSIKCHAYAMANSGVETMHSHTDTLTHLIP
jgi:hypothetical protein